MFQHCIGNSNEKRLAVSEFLDLAGRHLLIEFEDQGTPVVDPQGFSKQRHAELTYVAIDRYNKLREAIVFSGISSCQASGLITVGQIKAEMEQCKALALDEEDDGSEYFLPSSINEDIRTPKP